MSVEINAENVMYILSGAVVIVPVFFVLLFKINFGLKIFLVSSLCLQYLEKFNFGFVSALDVIGVAVPFLLLCGFVIKGNDPLISFKKDKVGVIFFLFILSTLLFGAIFSYFIVPSHSDIGLMGRIQRWGKLLNGFIVYFVLTGLTTDFERANRFLYCIVLAIIIPSMVMVYQLCIGETVSRWQGAYQIARAGFHHGNVLAYALVFSFPISVYNYMKSKMRSDRMVWLSAAVIIVVLIFLTYRRTVWVGLVVQFFFLYLLAEKHRTRMLFGYATFVSVLAFSALDVVPVLAERFSDIVVFFSNFPEVFTSDRYDYLFSGRWSFFRANLLYIFKQGIYSLAFGNGVGSTHYASALGGASGGDHNSYLILLIDFGLISLSLFIALIYGLFRRARLLSKSGNVESTRYGKLFLVILGSYLAMSAATHLLYFLTSGIWIFFSIAGMMSGIFLNMQEHTVKSEHNATT
jgi:hypothetical protein